MRGLVAGIFTVGARDFRGDDVEVLALGGEIEEVTLHRDFLPVQGGEVLGRLDDAAGHVVRTGDGDVVVVAADVQRALEGDVFTGVGAVGTERGGDVLGFRMGDGVAEITVLPGGGQYRLGPFQGFPDQDFVVQEIRQRQQPVDPVGTPFPGIAVTPEPGVVVAYDAGI